MAVAGTSRHGGPAPAFAAETLHRLGRASGPGRRGRGRWAVCLAAVLALHGLALWAAVAWMPALAPRPADPVTIDVVLPAAVPMPPQPASVPPAPEPTPPAAAAELPPDIAPQRVDPVPSEPAPSALPPPAESPPPVEAVTSAEPPPPVAPPPEIPAAVSSEPSMAAPVAPPAELSPPPPPLPTAAATPPASAPPFRALPMIRSREAPPRVPRVAALSQPGPARPAAPPQATAGPAAAPAPAAAPPAPSPDAVPGWQARVLGRLAQFKRYPAVAQLRGEQGTTYLRVSMDRAGRVLNAAVQRSSGSALLDTEALAIVARAQPLPVPPPELPGDPLELTVPVRFALQ